jgi:Spy/CpxP family protein refolding chaperone
MRLVLVKGVHMKMRTHTKALIGAGIIAALTVGGIFTFLAHADTKETVPAKGRFKKQLAQLGATDVQKAQVKAILRKYQPTAGPLIQEVVTERRALRDAIRAENHRRDRNPCPGGQGRLAGSRLGRTTRSRGA